MARQVRAYALGVSAVALWSTVASAFKVALRGLDPAQLLFYASLTSLLVLGGTLAARGKLREALRPSGPELARSAARGFLNPFLYYLVLFRAYDLLPAQVAQPLNYTWAVVLAVLSVPVLRQRLSARDAAACVIAYLGVVVVSLGRANGGGGSAGGVALALGSAFIWASYWVWSTLDRRDPVSTLFLSFLFGTPLALLWCASVSTLRVAAPGALLGAAYVGVVEMSVAFVLWLSALRLSTSAARIGNLVFLSPFLSLLLIRLVVGETIRPSTVAGLVLIVGGLVVQGASRLRRGEGDGGTTGGDHVGG
ncbi:MAG: DMT family transporter [Candidatus Eisenbacteria bacterium]|nr:DMT family transporter [Candidatus Eisenbacteria bacterium]